MSWYTLDIAFAFKFIEYFKSYLSGEEVILQRNAAHGSIAENVDVINQGKLSRL